MAAGAVPATYSFTTHGVPFGSAGPLAAFGADSTVRGSFRYDPEVPFTLAAANGAWIYNASFTSLSGSVAGLSFADPLGYTVVGNEVVTTFSLPASDWLQLGADPAITSSGTHNLAGFDVPGYRLVNVRLFWIEGQAVPDLIGEFLDDQDLPALLPSFNGRLALDFVPNPGTSRTLSFVFFDDLQVTRVPLPDTLALVVLGAAGLALRALRGRGLARVT